MKDYVVQSGPLRTFDHLFDPRFEKLKPVADCHTIYIAAKPSTKRIMMDRLRREISQEIVFISTFFSALAADARTIFGLRDITAGKAAELAKALWNRKDIQWHRMNYGNTEDDLTLVELKNFADDFEFLRPFVPPSEGTLFCYLTAAPFDVFQIYWERACQISLKSKEDRIRRDIASLANRAKVTVWQDPDGSFTVMLNTTMTDVEKVEKELTAAGEKAGISITFAPGLFG